MTSYTSQAWNCSSHLIGVNWRTLTSLAPSTNLEFSISILKLHVKWRRRCQGSLIDCRYTTNSSRNVKKVNYSLTQKVAETVALEQRLTTAECQNRAVSNKLYRHNELTKASKVIRNKLRINRLPRIIHFF